MLERGTVAGCGMRAEVGTDLARGMFQVTLQRRAAGTEFVIAGRLMGGAADGREQISEIAIVTSSFDTRTLFPPASLTGPDSLETVAKLDPSLGASFMREVIIGGAKVTIARAGDRPFVIELPMPTDPRVRATYLQCAGDLFRAGE